MLKSSVPKSSRRSVLKKGLFGGAILALGGVGVALRPSRDEPLPSKPLSVVQPHEYSVLAALARCFVPEHKDFPTPDSLGLAANADAILAMTDASAQMELRQLLNLFENALPNLIFGGRIKPFTQMPMDQQLQVLDEWRLSRISIRRTGFTALRALVMAAYYGDKRTWGAVGYHGPPEGFHQPDAPVYTGGDQPRPAGNGVWQENG